MNNRLTAIAMAGMLLGAFTIAPVSTVVAKPTHKQLVASTVSNNKLKNIDAKGTLSDGGTYDGKIDINQLGYNQSTKKLRVSGVFNGKATLKNGTVINLKDVPFKEVDSTLAKGAASKQVGTCDILFLDIGPIFLDVLGLTVDLSEIVLDINAVAGAGNLLGNLLCSLVGLLDGTGPLAQILAILQQINAILGSL